MKLVTEEQVIFAEEKTSSIVSTFGWTKEYRIASGPFGPDDRLYATKELALEYYNLKHCYRYISAQEAREWHEKLPLPVHGFYWNYLDDRELDFGGGQHLALWDNETVREFIDFLWDNNIIHDRYIDRSGNRCIKAQIG